MREWRHFEAFDKGRACILHHHRSLKCPYRLGVVTTGRQRVFQGWFVEIELPDGKREIAEDAQSLLFAAKALGRRVSLKGYRLFAAALDRRFYQTGLSCQTPVGYLDGCDGSIHMMDGPPYPRRPANGESYIEG